MQEQEGMNYNRILVIDDNNEIHDDFRKVLKSRNNIESELAELEEQLFANTHHGRELAFEIDFAEQGKEGYQKVLTSLKNKQPYSVVFVDIRMPPGWDGVETIEKIWSVHPETEIVICTAYSDYTWREISTRLKNHSNFLILKKPFDSIEVKQLAASLCEKTKMRRATEQRLKDVKKQLLQSEKLASIGQLAAGVAHEINNPVGFINSNMGTFEDYVKDLLTLLQEYKNYEMASNDADKQRILEKINVIKQDNDFEFLQEDIINLISESKEGVARVKQIIQDLKDFARVGDHKFECVDIHHCIESTLNVANNEIKYKAEVVKEYSDLPSVECIPHQINQVLLNLIVNACHAIKNKGVITIKTQSLEHDIKIMVSDTGKGIDPNEIQKIFDPFYTTKPSGQGTGLGLALSYGIIESHHGQILVESEMGKGTTFTITLPKKQKKQVKNAKSKL